MLRIMQMFVALILLTSLEYGQALIQIPFTFTDGNATHVQTLTVGLDPSATDDFDSGLDTYAPPYPPGGGFDAHFILPVGANDWVYKDIRQGDNTAASIGNRVHVAEAQLGTGYTSLQLSWNLPNGGELTLQDDNTGGAIFNANFGSGAGNYTVPFSFTKVRLIVKYIESPFPVELTSFMGSVKDNGVELRWETATEVNNYGFEIERKTESEGWTKIGFVEGHGNSNSPKSYAYEDNNLKGGSKFEYRLKQIDADGKTEYSDVVEVEVLPSSIKLNQNYPNPFNPETRIDYQLPVDSKVTLELYGISGEKVATLINGEVSAGYYSFDVNAHKLNLASGVYIYRMMASNQIANTQPFINVKKLILMK